MLPLLPRAWAERLVHVLPPVVLATKHQVVILLAGSHGDLHPEGLPAPEAQHYCPDGGGPEGGDDQVLSDEPSDK